MSKVVPTLDDFNAFVDDISKTLTTRDARDIAAIIQSGVNLIMNRPIGVDQYGRPVKPKVHVPAWDADTQKRLMHAADQWLLHNGRAKSASFVRSVLKYWDQRGKVSGPQAASVANAIGWEAEPDDDEDEDDDPGHEPRADTTMDSQP